MAATDEKASTEDGLSTMCFDGKNRWRPPSSGKLIRFLARRTERSELFAGSKPGGRVCVERRHCVGRGG